MIVLFGPQGLPPIGAVGPAPVPAAAANAPPQANANAGVTAQPDASAVLIAQIRTMQQANADAFRPHAFHVDAAVIQGEAGGGHGKPRRAAHDLQTFSVLAAQVRRRVEVRHFRGNLYRMSRGVERSDRADAALAFDARFPKSVFADAVRRYDSNACHDHSAHGSHPLGPGRHAR